MGRSEAGKAHAVNQLSCRAATEMDHTVFQCNTTSPRLSDKHLCQLAVGAELSLP